jgi:predicted HicB family RNase H-like nuclease
MTTSIKNRGYRIQDAIHQMAIDESQATGLSLNKTVEALIQEAYIARRLAKMGMTR